MTAKLGQAFRMVAIGGLLAGAVLLPATAAQAAPSNCTSRYDLNTFSVYCGKGSGDFRAKVRCYRAGSTQYATRYGPWKVAGSTRSVAYCTTSEDAASGTWELRN
ncbi:hypothetical protein [Streptosporangium sp. 'caverna']|uniref:hypothetical protein n=1 Tax=Streptosporangium sp. 'caverna' TaxID=2202249 RepID=UPI0013A6DC5C|nr:hypothetical protein [Streptosporangium sp. 'caverna']